MIYMDEGIYRTHIAADWRALITFQQLTILEDSRGHAHATRASLARVTGIPQEIIDAGLDLLEQKDGPCEGPWIRRIEDEIGWYMRAEDVDRA